jgi:hypothetical protein
MREVMCSNDCRDIGCSESCLYSGIPDKCWDNCPLLRLERFFQILSGSTMIYIPSCDGVTTLYTVHYYRHTSAHSYVFIAVAWLASSNCGRSSASGLTSSQAGGHFTPASYSCNCRIKNLPQSQGQSYITTDGQSASLSWCQTPI